MEKQETKEAINSKFLNIDRNVLGPTDDIPGRVKNSPLVAVPKMGRKSSARHIEQDEQAGSVAMETDPKPQYAIARYGAPITMLPDYAFNLMSSVSGIDTTAVTTALKNMGVSNIFDNLRVIIRTMSGDLAVHARTMPFPAKVGMALDISRQLNKHAYTTVVSTISANTSGGIEHNSVDGNNELMAYHTAQLISTTCDTKTPCPWPSNVYWLLQLVYVLFTGENCFSNSTAAITSFQSIQASYLPALNTAVRLLAMPLDAQFVGRDISTSVSASLIRVLPGTMTITNPTIRMQMITTAFITGLRFPEARRIHFQLTLSQARQTAAVMQMTYQTAVNTIDGMTQQIDDASLLED